MLTPAAKSVWRVAGIAGTPGAVHAAVDLDIRGGKAICWARSNPADARLWATSCTSRCWRRRLPKIKSGEMERAVGHRRPMGHRPHQSSAARLLIPRGLLCPKSGCQTGSIVRLSNTAHQKSELEGFAAELIDRFGPHCHASEHAPVDRTDQGNVQTRRNARWNGGPEGTIQFPQRQISPRHKDWWKFIGATERPCQVRDNKIRGAPRLVDGTGPRPRWPMRLRASWPKGY